MITVLLLSPDGGLEELTSLKFGFRNRGIIGGTFTVFALCVTPRRIVGGKSNRAPERRGSLFHNNDTLAAKYFKGGLILRMLTSGHHRPAVPGSDTGRIPRLLLIAIPTPKTVYRIGCIDK